MYCYVHCNLTQKINERKEFQSILIHLLNIIKESFTLNDANKGYNQFLSAAIDVLDTQSNTIYKLNLGGLSDICIQYVNNPDAITESSNAFATNLIDDDDNNNNYDNVNLFHIANKNNNNNNNINSNSNNNDNSHNNNSIDIINEITNSNNNFVENNSANNLIIDNQ